MKKEAIVALWVNQIQNKRNNFCDVPLKLQDEVYQILVQMDLNFENIEKQKLGER